MNEEEAKIVIEILLCADHGCPTCAAELIRYFIEEFPQYEELARKRFSETFKFDLDED